MLLTAGPRRRVGSRRARPPGPGWRAGEGGGPRSCLRVRAPPAPIRSRCTGDSWVGTPGCSGRPMRRPRRGQDVVPDPARDGQPSAGGRDVENGERGERGGVRFGQQSGKARFRGSPGWEVRVIVSRVGSITHDGSTRNAQWGGRGRWRVAKVAIPSGTMLLGVASSGRAGALGVRMMSYARSWRFHRWSSMRSRTGSTAKRSQWRRGSSRPWRSKTVGAARRRQDLRRRRRSTESGAWSGWCIHGPRGGRGPRACSGIASCVSHHVEIGRAVIHAMPKA